MGALQAMSPRGRIVLAVSALGIVFVAFMLFRVASAPSYTTLQAGVDPAKTGKITAALDQAGVSYKLAEQRHRHRRRLRPGVQGARRPRRPGAGRRRLAARLRAPRQAEARLLHLPAADRLPARPRGPDRPDHRADRRHLGRPGPAHAAQGRPLRRREAARHRGRAPQRRRHRARSRRHPRHRLAGLLQRAQPQALQRHDHRRDGLDAVAAGRRRRRGRHRLQAGGRGSLRRGHADHARRADRPHGRLRQGPGPGPRRPQRRQGDPGAAAVRQEGHAAGDDQGDREPEGLGQRRRRDRRRGRQPPDLRAERGGGRAATRTTSAPPARRRSASTRPSRARRSPPAPSTSSTSRCWSTSRCLRPRPAR